jgi:hypothetical protein
VRGRRLAAVARALAALALAGCAGQPAVRIVGNVPPTNETVLAEVAPGVRQHYIVVTNYSSQTVRVTAVTLLTCENVRGPCGRIPLKVDVAPGQRRQVHTVQAANPSEPFQFTWVWSWELLGAASSGPPVH